MEPRPSALLIYKTKAGLRPFEAWLNHLRDIDAQARILSRIDRLRIGLVGDCKPVGAGVYELRVATGPSYRVYFGQQGETIVILLTGGKVHSEQGHQGGAELLERL